MPAIDLLLLALPLYNVMVIISHVVDWKVAVSREAKTTTEGSNQFRGKLSAWLSQVAWRKVPTSSRATAPSEARPTCPGLSWPGGDSRCRIGRVKVSGAAAHEAWLPLAGLLSREYNDRALLVILGSRIFKDHICFCIFGRTKFKHRSAQVCASRRQLAWNSWKPRADSQVLTLGLSLPYPAGWSKQTVPSKPSDPHWMYVCKTWFQPKIGLLVSTDGYLKWQDACAASELKRRSALAEQSIAAPLPISK